jgi:hypothetical protein
MAGGGDTDSRPLVGRERELAAIDSVLGTARSGAGELLLIEGPAGIGKTSLLGEARRAAAPDMLVLRGVGTAFEREYPGGGGRQPLRDPRASIQEEVDASPFGILNGL